jgi:hypothetical protein
MTRVRTIVDPKRRRLRRRIVSEAIILGCAGLPLRKLVMF